MFWIKLRSFHLQIFFKNWFKSKMSQWKVYSCEITCFAIKHVEAPTGRNHHSFKSENFRRLYPTVPHLLTDRGSQSQLHIWFGPLIPTNPPALKKCSNWPLNIYRESANQHPWVLSTLEGQITNLLPKPESGCFGSPKKLKAPPTPTRKQPGFSSFASFFKKRNKKLTEHTCVSSHSSVYLESLHFLLPLS